MHFTKRCHHEEGKLCNTLAKFEITNRYYIDLAKIENDLKPIENLWSEVKRCV